MVLDVFVYVSYATGDLQGQRTAYLKPLEMDKKKPIVMTRVLSRAQDGRGVVRSLRPKESNTRENNFSLNSSRPRLYPINVAFLQ